MLTEQMACEWTVVPHVSKDWFLGDDLAREDSKSKSKGC